MSLASRQRWLAIHRWLGLTFGLLLVLLGLTGSLLVFDHAIDEWLNPELLLTKAQGKPASVEAVIRAAEQSFAGTALSVSRPRVADGVWTVWFQSGSETNPKYVQVLVDPYTARVTGQRVWGEYLMTWIYRLHYQLMAGESGAAIVGGMGMVTVASIVSGLFLWYPLWRHSWRAAFSVRRHKFSYDLHKSGGVATAVVLFVIAFTGVYMEFPSWFHAALSPWSQVSQPPYELKSGTPKGLAPLTPDQAIAVAQKKFPQAEFDHLHPPLGPDGFYEVAFRQSGEIQQSFGRTQVFLDQYGGDILVVRSPETFTAADAFVAWQFPLHNGEAFGLLGRWIVFIVGIAPAVLYVSGLRLWWRRSRKRNTSPSQWLCRSDATCP
ncbi:MAG: PepSY-associated TM helix domain-containing protein [Planctomycetaceae bacterium]